MNKEEEYSQIAFVDWFKWQHPQFARLITLPSFGENIGGRRMNRLKSMGLTPGFPDIAIFVTNNVYPGLLIEMKSKDGKLKKHQESIHLELIGQGYKVVTCYSWDEAKDATTEYLKGPNKTS